jgi:hypothetical protein
LRRRGRVTRCFCGKKMANVLKIGQSIAQPLFCEI